jgi:hypothetical protein
MEAPPFWLALHRGVLQNGMPTCKDMEAPPFWLTLRTGVLQNGMPTCKVIMHLYTPGKRDGNPNVPKDGTRKF